MEWMDNLTDEDLKGDEGLKKFDSIDALAKGYKNIEAYSGNSIRINGPEASAEDKSATYQKVMKHMPELMLRPNPDDPEQMAEYYSMLGVPKSTEDYDAGETSLTPEMIGELKQLAADTHMTRPDFKIYAKRMDEMNGATKQNNEDTRLAMGAELKGEWGLAFEDRYQMAENHIKENPGFGSIENMTPDQIRAHYETARSLIGKPQAHSQPNHGNNAMTPDEAKYQMDEIMNNVAYMSSEPQHRQEHQRLLIKMNELRKASDPELYG
jgi:hypothetical protein